MTHQHIPYAVSLFAAGTGIMAQAVLDGGQASTAERLGVAGILVAASFFLLKYFMKVVADKDEEIKTLNAKVLAEFSANTAIKAELRESQRDLSAAVRELTDVVRDRR